MGHILTYEIEQVNDFHFGMHETAAYYLIQLTIMPDDYLPSPSFWMSINSTHPAKVNHEHNHKRHHNLRI